jgi:hypothetical protein
MKDKVNIMCLYWTGDFRERKFTANDVWRLHASVTKHIDRPFDFYVLTNDVNANVPGTRIKLLHGDDWPGWWSKMELYRPDLPLGRTLYMDLDSHAIKSLQPILDFEGDLALFDDATIQHKPTHKRRNEGGWVYRYQAATILFNPREFVGMYEKFERDWDYYLTHYRSDQDILGDWMPDQPTFPKAWMIKLADLYKQQLRHTKKSKEPYTPPEDVIIVTGQPKNGLFYRIGEIEWFEKLARG